MTRPHPPAEREAGASAIVFAAACTGLARLSATTGLPLVHVGVTQDVGRALDRLNLTAHASAVRWQRSFQPLDVEPHWDDWACFEMEEDDRSRAVPGGLRLRDGCIVVPLPAQTLLAEFTAQLSAAMRHLRLQDAAIRPGYLEARSEADPFGDVVVHPRYTLRRPHEFRRASLVTDLFALDPAEDSAKLAWFAAAARLQACEGSRAPWR